MPQLYLFQYEILMDIFVEDDKQIFSLVLRRNLHNGNFEVEARYILKESNMKITERISRNNVILLSLKCYLPRFLFRMINWLS